MCSKIAPALPMLSSHRLGPCRPSDCVHNISTFCSTAAASTFRPSGPRSASRTRTRPRLSPTRSRQGNVSSPTCRPDRTIGTCRWSLSIRPVPATSIKQCFYERNGSGYRVWYAIADVAAFVTPGGPLDTATRNRGETLYSPDLRTPLHPVEMSEASRQPAAGCRPSGRPLDHRHRRARPADSCGSTTSLRAVDRPARLSRLPDRHAGGHIAPVDRAATRNRETPPGRGAGKARHHPRSTGRRDRTERGRPLDSRPSGRVGHRVLQRRDQPADRDLCGRPDAASRRRGATNAAGSQQRCDRGTPPVRDRPRHPVAQRSGAR